jgi:hypothetical protein
MTFSIKCPEIRVMSCGCDRTTITGLNICLLLNNKHEKSSRSPGLLCKLWASERPKVNCCGLGQAEQNDDLVHTWPPVYTSLFSYTGNVVFVAFPSSLLCAHAATVYSTMCIIMRCLNVTYIFPVFPHSVSAHWREQSLVRLVQLYQSLPSQTTSIR